MGVRGGSSRARDLPEDCLRCIFGFIEDVDDRRRVLPLVCKPWAEACAGPSHLWARLDIDADSHAATAGGRLRWAQARKWLAARGRSVEHLTLTPRHAAPAGGLAPLWPALGGGLKTLSLQLERVQSPTRKQTDLSGLSQLTGLQSLKLTGPAAPSANVSAALAEGLAPLTQLHELTLNLAASQFTMLRPDLPAVIIGALVNLRVLDLDLASFAPPPAADDGEEGQDALAAGGNMLPACIVRLTKLETLRLCGDWRRPKVKLPPGFAALAALEVMQLTTLELVPPRAGPSGFTPAPQAAPPKLRQLLLEDCTGDFPFGSALGSLRIMRLEACDEMHIAAAAMQALQEAKKLEATVVLSDPSLEHLPDFLEGLPPSVRLTAKRSRKD